MSEERDAAVARVRRVVAALGPLAEQVVLVGGSAPAAWPLTLADIRGTPMLTW
jgi:hypothetical protein